MHVHSCLRFSGLDDKPIEDQQKVDWLLANRRLLQNENIPILNILDLLVDGKVLDPRLDDYQDIFYTETPRGKIRALVDVLLTKPPGSFPIFVAALKTLCPHSLEKCIDPPEVFRQFDSEMRTHFRALDEEEMMAFSWLKRTSSRIKITDYLRHLAVIDKRQSEAMAAEKLASSAKELERQQLLHSRPDKVELVELENVFGEEPRDRTRRDVDGATPSDAQVETLRSKATSGAAVLGGKEADVPLWKTQPRKRVGVYGAAGCGKTASLMKLACLYARGKLWHTRFRSFMFWKLREHNVARAETFEQLLKELPFRSFSSSSQKRKDFAEAALACDGRGLLVVLDGFDELETSLGQKSFVRRLLEGNELREACVLVTSRPFTRARDVFEEYDVNLELLGFREEQVTEFILQRLGNKPELISKLEEVLARNASMAAMMSVPLLAFLICDVFCACPNRPPTTRTQLYSKLLTLIVQRAVAEGRVRLSDDGEVEEDEESDLRDASGVHQIDGTAKKLLIEMAEVAWEAMKKDLAIFGHALVRKAGCSSKALKLGLLAFDRRVVEEHSVEVRQYSFHHMTVQEFLVALLLVEQTGDSEEKLREKLGKFEMGPHQFVVIQFLAGLLPARLLPVLFSFLNTFLHHNWNERSAECVDRLRLCLQCVREAYVDGKTFPHTLQLPKKVSLWHVSAADMELLSSSLDKCPSSLEELSLVVFDSVKGEAEKFTRVQTQTRNALERLMAVLSVCKSLRVLSVRGSSYKLFTEESWRCLVKIGHNNPLQKLFVAQCLLDDDDVCELASELQHCTQLSELVLYWNMIGDRGVRRLADSLKHIHTLRGLVLKWNSYGQDSKDFLRQQLKHIPRLSV